MESPGWRILSLLFLAVVSGAAASEAPALIPRDSLVELQDARFDRARRSPVVFAIAGGAEAVVGAAFLFASDELDVQLGAGVGLLAGGLAHAATGLYQLNLAQRRRGAFMARMAAVEGSDSLVWLALAEEYRLGAERQARGYAFSTGIHAGVLGAGLLMLAVSAAESDLAAAGGAMAAVGAVGLVHGASRWRAAAGLSADLAVLDGSVPPGISYGNK